MGYLSIASMGDTLMDVFNFLSYQGVRPEYIIYTGSINEFIRIHLLNDDKVLVLPVGTHP